MAQKFLTDVKIKDTSNLFVDGKLKVGDLNAATNLLHVKSASADTLARFTSDDNLAKIIVEDNDTATYIGASDDESFLGPNSSATSPANIRLNSSTARGNAGYAAYGGAPNGAYKFNIVAGTLNTSSDLSYTALRLDIHGAGTDTLTADKYLRGMVADVDSSASGGNTNHEFRIYGGEFNVKDTGDADLVYGVYAFAMNEKTDASFDNVTTLAGLRAAANIDNTAGTVSNSHGVYGTIRPKGSGAKTNMYASRFDVNGGASDANISLISGVYSKTDLSDAYTGTVGKARGGYFEIESENNNTYTSVDGLTVVIDHNGGTITDAVQLKLTTSGTISGDNWGIYSTGAAKHRIDGKLSVNTLGEPTHELTVGGDAKINGDIFADNITSTSNSGTASLYINSTRPTIGFSDTNSYTDPADVYIVRGTGGGSLQFQWYDDSAGTTTETFNITSSGNATFQGDIDVNGTANTKQIEFFLGSSNGDYAAIGAQRAVDNLYCSSEIRFINENNSSGAGAISFQTGLNSVTERLRISSTGEITFTGIMNASDGSAATPAYNFASHDGNGMYLEEYDASNNKEQVCIASDGVRRFRANEAGIWSDQNVYFANQLRKFGEWHATSGTAGAGFKFENTADSTIPLTLTSAGNATFLGKLAFADVPHNTSSTSVFVKDQVTTALSVTNSDFAADSNWTKGDGWSISGGKATVDGSQTGTSYLYQSGVLGNPSHNKTYIVTYTISSYSAGEFRINIGGYQSTSPAQTANGTYTVELTVTHASSNTILYVQANADAVGSVDNISIKELVSSSNNINQRELGSLAFSDGTIPTDFVSKTNGGTFNGAVTINTNTKPGLVIKASGNTGNDQVLVVRGSRNDPSAGVKPAAIELQTYDHDTTSNVTGGEFYMEATSLTTTALNDFEVGIRYRKDGSIVDGIKMHDGVITVNGDLVVQGDTTTLNTQTVEVEDNILLLNKTGTTATAATSGISIYRGSSSTAGFIFDDGDDTWDLSHNLKIASTLETGSTAFFYGNGAAAIKFGNTSTLVTMSYSGTTGIMRAESGSALEFHTNGVNNALTLDTSQNATFTGSINVNTNGLIKYEQNTDVDSAAAEAVASVIKATHTAAFFDYVIKKGTNVRAGVVTACHDGTNVEYAETSTVSLGDTSDVTLSVDISGIYMRLIATTTSNDWSVKSLIRAI